MKIYKDWPTLDGKRGRQSCVVREASNSQDDIFEEFCLCPVSNFSVSFIPCWDKDSGNFQRDNLDF